MRSSLETSGARSIKMRNGIGVGIGVEPVLIIRRAPRLLGRKSPRRIGEKNIGEIGRVHFSGRLKLLEIVNTPRPFRAHFGAGKCRQEKSSKDGDDGHNNQKLN